MCILPTSISSHFGAIYFLNVCRSRKSQKMTKIPYFGGSRSFELAPIKSLSLLLVMINNMSVIICNRFHATRDNCGKTTTFRKRGEVAVFDARLR